MKSLLGCPFLHRKKINPAPVLSFFSEIHTYELSNFFHGWLEFYLSFEIDLDLESRSTPPRRPSVTDAHTKKGGSLLVLKLVNGSSIKSFWSLKLPNRACGHIPLMETGHPSENTEQMKRRPLQQKKFNAEYVLRLPDFDKITSERGSCSPTWCQSAPRLQPDVFMTAICREHSKGLR